MTTAPVSHSNPKGKEKEKEKEKEKQEEDKEHEQEQEQEEEKQEEEKEKEQEKKKEKVKKKEKEKVEKKEKKVEVISCDVKEKYPFEGFNIDGEGPTELMSSFSQWINEGLYKHHAKKRVKDDHYLANCSDLEFKQLDFVFAFPKKKDWFYVMSQPNKCWTDEGKKKSHTFEVIHVTGIAQQASNSLDCGVFLVAYTEFLSDGLQIPSDGIISQSLHLRYASLLWNYGILKARSGYVSNNEDSQRPRPKKAKFDENVVVTTID
ncbi:hypothetical protein KY285_007986 [Solanum tuberosum]|nr:hypothetical protein KY285_007986 [Solanum tuberosum]